MSEFLTDTREKVAGLLASIDAQIATTTPSKPVVTVKLGDNLASLLAAGAPETTYVLPPDYVFAGDFEQTKPGITLTRADLATVPPVRATAAFGGPELKGHFINRGERFTTQGIRSTGQNKDRAIWELYGAGTIFDRAVIRAGDAGGIKGIYLAAPDFTIRKGHVGNCWYKGQESQAITVPRDAHRGLVDDCYLEASGENFLIGGDDIRGEERMVHDFALVDCHLFKPLAWKGTATVKNLFELKAATKVSVTRCTFENNWVDAQAGLAMVLTIRNQYGRDPYATLQDISFDDCTLKGSPGGLSILGRDDIRDAAGSPVRASVRMARVAFRNFKMLDMQGGRAIQITGGPKDLTFDGLTVEGRTSTFMEFGQPEFLTEGLSMQRASFLEGDYGIHGDQAPGMGKVVLDMYAPGYQWANNTVKLGGQRYIAYPAGTTRVI